MNPPKIPAKRTIVVVGPGALGTAIAVLLAHDGHEVVVIARRAGEAERRPVRLFEAIGGREVTAPSLDIRPLSDMPPRPDAVFVCTRGDQVKAAIEGLAGRIRNECPLVVPGVTFDDLDALARQCGLTETPMIRLAIGFAVWRKEPGHYHLFPLSRFGSMLAPESSAPPALCRDLAEMLSSAGLPTRAVAPGPFLRRLHAFNALQLPFLLAWGEAGWSLEALRRDRRLLSACATAMVEVARTMRASTGALGSALRLVPRWGFALLIRLIARMMPLRLGHFFLQHGPKIQAQLRFNAEQIGTLAAARGEGDRALRGLLARADPSAALPP